MDIRALIQQTLDSVLLKDGILSHHIRRSDAATIANSSVKVSKDEYVVYRLVSTKGGGYGDGEAQLVRQYIDINYYYAFDKTDARFKEAQRRIDAIVAAFKSDKRFRLVNGQSDLYDLDNPYRGINVEFLFVGVANV